MSAQVPVRAVGRRLRRRGRIELDAARAFRGAADLAVFHDFAPAPVGGGNQTLRAILGEMQRRGVRVEYNTISRVTRACLFNSFNFDFDRLEVFARRRDGVRMVHRVGAVTTLYRGRDDGTDARVGEINRQLADGTIAISRATLTMYSELGIEFIAPRVIYNGTDPSIFHPHGRATFDRTRPLRVISASWSANPRKGAPTFKWLEENLDPTSYELTFVGNAPVEFARAKHVPPLPSVELAQLLRAHDVFFTATEHDAYSNALVEALSCGLPAIYLDSGGSAEAVKEAGFGFHDREEVPPLLARLREEYLERQAAISLPSLAGVTDDYLDALGLADFVGGI